MKADIQEVEQTTVNFKSGLKAFETKNMQVVNEMQEEDELQSIIMQQKEQQEREAL